MGEVYRARDPRLGRDVAIKILPADVAADPDRLRRFDQEARAAAALNHPNILSIHDAGSDNGVAYLVTELLEGQTLSDVLTHATPSLRPDRALNYAGQIAEGLAAAHAHGIIHRDLKPANVFVTTDGRVKILDFGLAKVVPASLTGETDTATASGVMFGTVGYMAPEQIRGEAVDGRTDIFAFGCVLYEMLAGRRAFDGASPVETLSAILKESPAPLVAHPSEHTVSPMVVRIVDRCLEKVPAARFQTAADLAFALKTASAQGGFVARRRGLVALVAISAALAAIAAASLWLMGWPWSSKAPGLPVAGLARATPFLATAAIERQPALSPDGNLVAFVSDEAGNDDIWISDEGGANPVNLTAISPGTDSFPAWSPDGRRLAFYSEREGGGIFVMTLLGAEVRPVVRVKPSVLYTFSLAWAGVDTLVYTDFDPRGRKDVYRVGLEGTPTPTCLTCISGLAGGRAGTVSTSGRFLAFASTAIDAASGLYLMDLRSMQLTQFASQSDWPAWTDNSKIVFVSVRDGTADLWEAAVDEQTGAIGAAQRITSGMGVSVSSSFGLRRSTGDILVVKDTGTAHLWAFQASQGPLLDLTTGVRLTDGDFRDTHGRWRPDQDTIVFQSNRRGSMELWTLPGGATQPLRLTSGGEAKRPSISFDGRWIAFERNTGGTQLVSIMRTAGGAAHVIDAAWAGRYGFVCCAHWSPDGRLTVTVARPRGKPTVAIVDIDDAGVATSTTELALPGNAEYGQWSPDGRLMAFEAQTEGSWDIWVASTDGGSPRRLTSFPGNERAAFWQPGTSYLYFRRDFNAIWRMPLRPDGTADGEATLWMKFPRAAFEHDSLEFSRSGDRLLATVITKASDVWRVDRQPR